MRRLLLIPLLCLSCRTPTAFSWSTNQTPETAACVQQCGHLRNECAETRRLTAFAFLWLGSIYVENACSSQFDHCVSICPGIREPPSDVKRSPPESVTPLQR